MQPASLSAAGAGLRLLGFGREQLPIIYSVGERRPAGRRPSVAGLRDVYRRCAPIGSGRYTDSYGWHAHR